MFHPLDALVLAFAIALPVLVTAILVLGAVRAGLAGRQIARVAVWIAVISGLWFVASVSLASAGRFRVPESFVEPPIVLAFLFGGSALVWALARLTPIGRRVTDATPLSTVASLQIARIMGGVFLIGWLMGRVPPEFAIPAGLGDIWAGLAAYRASQALALGAPEARRRLARANTIGLLDVVLAVTLGVLTSEGLFHALSKDAPNIINDYPLALFPAFLVPIFVGFHLISMSLLRAEARMQLHQVERRHG